jgi:hypothetical protein
MTLDRRRILHVALGGSTLGALVVKIRHSDSHDI